jgi:hypothetical protein
MELNPIVIFGLCSALAAETDGGLCTENIMYQMDAFGNRDGHFVHGHLHKFADDDFHFSDRVSVESSC